MSTTPDILTPHDSTPTGVFAEVDRCEVWSVEQKAAGDRWNTVATESNQRDAARALERLAKIGERNLRIRVSRAPTGSTATRRNQPHEKARVAQRHTQPDYGRPAIGSVVKIDTKIAGAPCRRATVVAHPRNRLKLKVRWIDWSKFGAAVQHGKSETYVWMEECVSELPKGEGSCPKGRKDNKKAQ